MCGIAGIIAKEFPQRQPVLQNMLDVLRHRGPDDRGSVSFPYCALGHTRLSIVDLATGAQPMYNHKQTLAITFNGEIYGYKTIRQQLQTYPFRTASDTEVILALYERYGSQCLSKLSGMFAFAIWDDARQELFCARDRFGEKPLYYAFGTHGEFIFASEIKAILISGLVTPQLNYNALAHYLQRLYVASYETIYTNVYTLPPAHCLSYQHGQLKVEPYWELPLTDETMTPNEAIEQFQALLHAAVAKQLVADVEVGAFLSGGMDSSTVVAIASQYTNAIKTISFGFDGDTSELPYARAVARQYGTDHIELEEHPVLRLDQLLLTMQAVYDEPFADSSYIPTYLIAKRAREYVKVILTGDGGDELLAGYSYWYRPLWNMQREQEQSRRFRELLYFGGRVIRRLRGPLSANMRDFLQGYGWTKKYQTIAQAHWYQQQYFTKTELETFGLKPCEFFPQQVQSNTVDDALRSDLTDYMPGDILVKIDRASMAHGLELRAPFLDVELASFCISLPFRLKMTSLHDKAILRQACEQLWPESVRNRPKQGFGAPVWQWLKRSDMQQMKREFLGDPTKKLYTLLDMKNSRKYLQEDSYKTWILLVLSVWLETREFLF
jgi:asparagine synthase (glutamine-hydrolysing)